MKIFLRRLTFTLLFISSTVFSQNYQILQPKQINVNDPCNSGFMVHPLEIKNNQEFDALNVSWKLVSKDIPSSVFPQFCDWLNCYPFDNLPSTQVDLQIPPADTGKFTLDIDVANFTATGFFKFEVFETANPSVRDTITFNIIACENPTGIANSLKTQILNVFPNPCAKELTINLPTELSSKLSEISIYNLLGKKVSSYSTMHQELLKINTSNLPEGVYFIKINEHSENSLTKRFVKIK